MSTFSSWGGALLLAGALLGAHSGVSAQTPAQAAPQGLDWQLNYGTSSSASVKKVGVIAGWQRGAPLWQGEQWRLTLRHELEVAFWRVPKAQDIVEAGYSPFLRLERPLQGSGVVFGEFSIGVRLLSHTRISPDHPLSSAFQFSDQIGAGYQWGPQGRSTLGVRYTHLSNAGIKKPNPGINFTQVYYRHRF
ncbi:acyloxyacyl hydrolase [Ottowia thiooxydans]|uniref:acyloxyacyl hydrolase n=1 Tax=Ottowia thiooxydans TaxID=219182 RepID=UPI00048EBD2E|nr:acyloxyacyl hydrolase [Ottowia thiooxydans]